MKHVSYPKPWDWSDEALARRLSQWALEPVQECNRRRPRPLEETRWQEPISVTLMEEIRFSVA